MSADDVIKAADPFVVGGLVGVALNRWAVRLSWSDSAEIFVIVMLVVTVARMIVALDGAA